MPEQRLESAPDEIAARHRERYEAQRARKQKLRQPVPVDARVAGRLPDHAVQQRVHETFDGTTRRRGSGSSPTIFSTPC